MSAPVDPKQGEREYFARIGEEGRRHSVAKPFSDEHCAQYLANVAAMMELMPKPPGRILEFGCGTGWLGQMFAQRGYEVIGVDISPDAIALAQATAVSRGLANATYQVADYETFAIATPVDSVIFHDALHHAESEADALRAAFAALRPGGMVLCLEPGAGHSKTASSRRAIEEFGVHEKDMPPAAIVKLARAIGFTHHVVLPPPAAFMRTSYRAISTTDQSRGQSFQRYFMIVYRIVRLLRRRRELGMVLLWKD